MGQILVAKDRLRVILHLDRFPISVLSAINGNTASAVIAVDSNSEGLVSIVDKRDVVLCPCCSTTET